MKIMDIIHACDDCHAYLANGDMTYLDYHYAEAKANERMQAIIAGERFYTENGSIIVIGDSANDIEFAVKPCTCCGSRLAGSRFEFLVTGNN